MKFKSILYESKNYEGIVDNIKIGDTIKLNYKNFEIIEYEKLINEKGIMRLGWTHAVKATGGKALYMGYVNGTTNFIRLWSTGYTYNDYISGKNKQ